EAAAILFVNDPYSGRKAERDRQERIVKATDKLIEAADALDGVDLNDGDKIADARKQLAQAVERVKSSRKDAAEGESDPLMEFGYGGNGSEHTVPVLHITKDVCNQLLQSGLGKTLDE